VSVSALRKKVNPYAAHRVSHSGVHKKKKLKTPKLGVFKTTKKDICVSHDRKGRLVVSGSAKVESSGFNTPRGIVPVDPLKMDPLGIEFARSLRDLLPQDMLAMAETPIDQPASSLLFASTTSLTGPLFSEDPSVNPESGSATAASTQTGTVEVDMSSFLDLDV
jgi:hypothetical protein